MILLTAYYLLVFAINSIVGVYALSFLKRGFYNPFLPVLVGIAFNCILALLLFISGPINYSGFILVTALPLLFIWLKPAVIKQYMAQLNGYSQLLKKQELFYVVVVFLCVLYQSAQATKIHDDGMYYQQTIMWAQQFGLTKGLANLHPALGLFSVWHLFTALFDPAIVGLPIFHHYNGLLLLAVILYFLVERNINPGHQKIINILLLILPVLGFMFLTAANVDLPLILLTLFVFYAVVIKSNFHIEVMLIALVCFLMKPPALLPVIILVYAFMRMIGSKSGLTFSVIAALLLMVFGYKNYMLSGYVLYPSAAINIMQPQWQVPKSVVTYYKTGVISWGVSDSFNLKEIDETGSLPIIKRAKLWLFRTGYKGLINKFMLVFMLIAAVWSVVSLFKNLKQAFNSLTIVALLLILFLDWLLLSQYRLLLPTFITLLAFLYHVIPFSLGVNFFKYAAVVLLLVQTTIPMQLLRQTSRNKSVTNFTGLSARFLIVPFSIFEKDTIKIVGEAPHVFNQYANRSYCWDCALPCMSKGVNNMLQSYFGYSIQYIDSNNFAKGFMPVSIK